MAERAGETKDGVPSTGSLPLTLLCLCLLRCGLSSTSLTLSRVLICPLPPFSLPTPHCCLYVSESPVSLFLALVLSPAFHPPCPPKTIDPPAPGNGPRPDQVTPLITEEIDELPE